MILQGGLPNVDVLNLYRPSLHLGEPMILWSLADAGNISKISFSRPHEPLILRRLFSNWLTSIVVGAERLFSAYEAPNVSLRLLQCWSLLHPTESNDNAITRKRIKIELLTSLAELFGLWLIRAHSNYRTDPYGKIELSCKWIANRLRCVYLMDGENLRWGGKQKMMNVWNERVYISAMVLLINDEKSRLDLTLTAISLQPN